VKRKLDWFLPGLVLAVGLAWLFPDPGAQGGGLHPELANKAGVALIFFLHGVALSFSALKAGVLRWPLHGVVQLCTFVVFPAIGLVIWKATAGWLEPDHRLGFFYLCALPSTVSSSVALTAAARGNVPAAVFNATLSSLLGIFLTPLWVSWIASTTGQPVPLGKVILDLVLWLLLPLAVGQCLRPWLSSWAARHKAAIHVVDRLTILMLVYTSFCDSMKSGVWNGGARTVAITIVAAGAIFVTVVGFVTVVCRVFGFPVEDRIAAVFCGSKKTLASGVPMARLIFGAYPGLSLILLPIMVYHTTQLLLGGMLASRWARRPADPA
jgi:sodium/bile acid cotransporter 7